MEIGFTLWSEKILQKGEDAQPTYLCNEKGRVTLAVFDGMGGAGSAQYIYEDNLYSGAYIAAKETKRFFEEKVNGSSDELADLFMSLEKPLFDHLQSVANSIDKNPSRLRSALIRRLPTTMAAAIASKIEEDTVTFLWSGDSRCYILSPEHGLTQLSVDDLRGGDSDALKNLRGDAPMSNYCNADVDFRINRKAVKIPKPFVLFTATDGCFGYLKSPFHFEGLLLTAMKDAQNTEEWKQFISDRIQEVTGDDYSMALFAFGFENFSSMQSLFDKRTMIIEQNYISKYDIVEREEFEAKIFHEDALAKRDQVLSNLWEQYKKTYQGSTL